jgi:glycogen debranching enzyme
MPTKLNTNLFPFGIPSTIDLSKAIRYAFSFKLMQETTEEHYFSVEPALKINGKDLPLAGLAIQSVTGKWMGPITEWSNFLKVFSDKGYNMIHFTPLNERGDSNSPYSIYNQLAFAPDLFDKDTSVGDQHTEISNMTSIMEKKYGLLSLTDVVWNHTAENSDWLQDHPEAGYNLYNSPHLIAAYQLDSALLDFSHDLRHLGYPTSIYTIDDLLKIMEGIKTHVLGGLRLWEFYIIEPVPTVSAILKSWKADEYDSAAFPDVDFSTMPLYEKAKLVADKGLTGAEAMGDRFKKSIRPGVGAAYLRSVHGEYHESKLSDVQRDITNIINEINLPFYKQFDDDRATILENIYNRVKYVRLDSKKGDITER